MKFAIENTNSRPNFSFCKLLHSQNGKFIEKKASQHARVRNSIYIGILCREMWKKKRWKLKCNLITNKLFMFGMWVSIFYNQRLYNSKKLLKSSLGFTKLQVVPKNVDYLNT